MSWFTDPQSKNKEEFEANNKKPKPRGFWIPTGQSREVIFVDDARLGIFEHKIQLNGHWEQFTCSGSDCVLCLQRRPKNYVEYFTVLDLTPWTNHEGKEVKFTRKPLAAGKSVVEILNKRREDLGGNLFGKKFKVSRLGDKSPGCGNDWINILTQKTLDLSKLPDFCQPYDFKEMLKPVSREALMKILIPNSFSESREAIPMAIEEGIPF